MVKNLPSNAGSVRGVGLIPGLGRSHGDGHGKPLQYSCLENSTDRGAWWATVYRVAKSRTRLKRLCMQCLCVNRNLLIYSSSFSNHKFLFYVCGSISAL